jgi:immunity protein, SdpI family
MTHEEQFLWAIGYNVFIILLFILVQKFPPKKINWYYGYRTSRSMKNEETWKIAQVYSSKKAIELALLSFVFPPIFYFIYPDNNFLLSVIVNTLLILPNYWFTEKHLEKMFDRDGNKK